MKEEYRRSQEARQTLPASTPTPAFLPLPGGYEKYSFYWYGKTYFDMLANTDGWWHNYRGQPFGMKTYIAIVYNYELSTLIGDPQARAYFTEAFARRYWQAQKDYGPDGAFWYLGGRQMVPNRVLAGITGIHESDYNLDLSLRKQSVS